MSIYIITQIESPIKNQITLMKWMIPFSAAPISLVRQITLASSLAVSPLAPAWSMASARCTLTGEHTMLTFASGKTSWNCTRAFWSKNFILKNSLNLMTINEKRSGFKKFWNKKSWTKFCVTQNLTYFQTVEKLVWTTIYFRGFIECYLYQNRIHKGKNPENPKRNVPWRICRWIPSWPEK